MAHIFNIILILLISSFIVISNAESINYKAHLGTKSLYYPSVEEYIRPPDSCKLKHVQYVGRHGDRQLNQKKLEEVESLIDELEKNQNLLPDTYKFLGQIKKTMFNLEDANELTMMGEDSIYNIAKRIIVKDPAFYNSTFKLNDYYFRATTVTRTLQSGSVFAFSMFEGKGNTATPRYVPVPLYLVPSDKDTTLRYFDNCPTYTNSVLRSDTSSLESKIFYYENFPKIADRINEKLNLTEKSWKFSSETISQLFDLCITEIQTLNTSYTCTLFEKEDLSIYEYYQDLKYYWQRSYGHNINWKIATPFLKEILERFAGVAGMNVSFSGNKGKKGEFFFGHAETVIPLYTILGLFNDKEKLCANNKNDNRQFKTSKISPFAANIYFKLYECDSQQDSNKKEYLMGIQVNEKQMSLPHCPADKLVNGFFCPFDLVYDHYNTSLFSSFNFNTTCGIKNNCFSRSEITSLERKINNLRTQSTISLVFTVLFASAFMIVTIFLIIFIVKVRRLSQRRVDEVPLHDANSGYIYE